MGTGNNGLRHRYSFKKLEKFKVGYISLMKSLGFEKMDMAFSTNEENLERELSINEFNDVCWYHKNKKYEVDTFFGNKKIIVVIRTNQKNKRDRRDRLIKNIMEKSDLGNIKYDSKKRISAINFTDRKIKNDSKK